MSCPLSRPFRPDELDPDRNAKLKISEPTTPALAGLGGLASLMAFRRKKA
jgi:hypothetical protein